MKVGERVDRGGFVSKEKFLKGCSLAEMEARLGFHSGRLRNGAFILKPIMLPTATDFELRGYSQVADHRYQASTGFDEGKLKQLAMNSWAMNGPDSLVKVVPLIGHDGGMDDDSQYPPGTGVPQWKLIKPIQFTVVAQISSYPSGKWV